VRTTTGKVHKVSWYNLDLATTAHHKDIPSQLKIIFKGENFSFNDDQVSKYEEKAERNYFVFHLLLLNLC
jgi:hypothetical protein